MSKEKEMRGGCLCGKVRYTLSDKPFAAEYCHCTQCQKCSGAPVVAWMDVKIKQVKWEKESPTEYASSDDVRRGFCSTCGSTLTYRDERHRDLLTFTISSLDEPNIVSPTYHIFTANALDWLTIDDDFPRHLGIAKK